MSGEINQLFVALEQLRKLLGDAIDKANEATGFADEIGGEFEQELSTDLDEIQTTLQELLDDLDTSIDEGKTLWEDEESMETSLRSGLDDEENYKVDSEHVQDELDQEKSEEKEDRK
ncbi:MAG: hypothetical protein V1710_08155 [Candidatus Bathyarchaeota archaeon]